METFPSLLYQNIPSLFVSVYFDLTRKKNDIELIKFGEKFSLLLNHVNKLCEPQCECYLHLIKQLIIFTRNITEGKGERDLSYMMIYLLYDIFPDDAVSLFYEIVPSHGSWRDIPGICEFIKRMSTSDHPLIEKAIIYANKQLHSDYNEIRKSDFESNTHNQCKISNVAKWIPREKSKNNWLFERLSEQWTQTYTPFLYTSALTKDINTQISALRKSRRLYRKIFVRLSETMDLIESKMCRGAWTNIDPNQLNYCTRVKNIDAFVGKHHSNNIERMICKERFLQHSTFTMRKCETNRENFTVSKKKKPIVYPFRIGEFAKKASELDAVSDPIQYNIINSHWLAHLNSTKNFVSSGCIPIIDISKHMQNTSSFYSAIGLSLWVAQQSSGRILFLCNQPYWKTIDKSDFISDIKSIVKDMPPATRKNIMGGFSLIINAIISSNMSPSQVERMKFVFFSDMDFSEELYSQIVSMFHNAGVLSSYKTPFPLPQLVYWNLSESSVDLPCKCDTKNVSFLSGDSSSSLYHFSQQFSSSDHAFDSICKIIRECGGQSYDSTLQPF
jgi:hypothetical protein